MVHVFWARHGDELARSIHVFHVELPCTIIVAYSNRVCNEVASLQAVRRKSPGAGSASPAPPLCTPPHTALHAVLRTWMPYCFALSSACSYTHFMCSSLSVSNSSPGRTWPHRMRCAYSMQCAGELRVRKSVHSVKYMSVAACAWREAGEQRGCCATHDCQCAVSRLPHSSPAVSGCTAGRQRC